MPIQQPPTLDDEDAASSASTSKDSNVTLELKCSKPALTYTLECSLTSTIAALKAKLVEQESASSQGVPAVDDQRWLIKGKVLSDTKLLSELSSTCKV